MDKSQIVIQVFGTGEDGMPVLKELPILRSAFLAFQFIMPDGQRIKISPDDAEGIQIFSTTGRIYVIPYAANAIRVRSVGFSSKPKLILEVKDGG